MSQQSKPCRMAAYPIAGHVKAYNNDLILKVLSGQYGYGPSSVALDWTVNQLLNPPKKPETLMQQVKREILSRDQSEDRMPPGGLYLVVGVENPPGLPEGRYYYVQHPLGGRNSGYAKQASAATRWATDQQADRDEYTPEDNADDVYYGD